MTESIGNQYRMIPAGVNIQIFNPVATPYLEQNECQHPYNNGYVTNPCYPSNYYTQDFSNKNEQAYEKNVSKDLKETKDININVKTEKEPKSIDINVEPKKKLVKLTDEYIMNLENYLDSKDVEKRILASKDILERVQEDESRKDNVALTALTNKMLKDPYQPIRFLALSILEDRLITGNEETVQILKKVETGRYSKSGNVDQDAIKASSVLLKMTRKVQE